MRVFRSLFVLPLVLIACGNPTTTGTVSGKVSLGKENPALVKVDLTGPSTTSVQAGADGTFSFPNLTAGTYVVTASAPSADPIAATQVVTVTEGTTQLPELTLAPYGSITGTVTVGPNSAGVILSVLGATAITTTEPSGAYTLAHVPAGKRTVLATAPGFVPGTLVDLEVPYNGSVSAPELTLAPSGGATLATIKGVATVIDHADHSGTVVTVEGSPATATTAADGSFVLEHAPLGVLTLHFKNGPFQATLPNVLALPGTDGFLTGASLQPLVPFDVPRSTKRSPRSLAEANIYSRDRKVFITTEHVGTSTLDMFRVNTIAGESFLLEAGATAPEITADGSRIVYSFTTLDEKTAIKAVPVTGGSAVTVVPHADVRSVTSPDGKYVLYFLVNEQSTYDLRSASLTTGSNSEIIATVSQTESASAASTRTTRTLVITPNSQTVVLVAGGSLRSAPVDGSAAATEITALTGVAQWVAVTPGGDTVLYYISGTQKAAGVALAAASTPYALDRQFNAPPTAYSPNGQYAVFSANGGFFYNLQPVAGGASIQLQNAESPPVFSADAAYVVWATSGAGNTVDIKRMLISTKETVSLVTGTGTNNTKTAVVLSPDAQTVYVNVGDKGSQVTAVNIAAGTTTVLSTKMDGTRGTLALSPDGAHLLFPGITSGTRALYSVPTGGGDAVAQLYTYDGAKFGWVSGSQYVVERVGTPAPFEFQDGIYAISAD